MRGKQDLGKSRVRERTMRQVVGAALSVRCQCTGKKGFTSYIVWSVQGRVWVEHEHQLMLYQQLGSGSCQELLLGCNENTCHRAEELRSEQEELGVQKEKHLFFLSYYQTKKDEKHRIVCFILLIVLTAARYYGNWLLLFCLLPECLQTKSVLSRAITSYPQVPGGKTEKQAKQLIHPGISYL